MLGVLGMLWIDFPGLITRQQLKMARLLVEDIVEHISPTGMQIFGWIRSGFGTFRAPSQLPSNQSTRIVFLLPDVDN